MVIKHTILVIALCALIAGCASGYNEFYLPNPNADRLLTRRAAPAPEEPVLEHAYGDPSEVVQTFARRGYVVIGTSSFNSGREQDDDDAIEQGSDIGADLVVVLQPKHTGTRTAVIPITTPTTTTSYTTSSATAYGTGGSATAYGNATTTSYGTKTDYVPFTVERFDYGAIYMIKTRPIFGAFFRELTDSERQALQTNRGVVVLTVVDDSPAYTSDVLVGDVLVSMDDESTSGAQRTMDLIQQKRGRDVKVELLRNGKRVIKTVAFAD